MFCKKRLVKSELRDLMNWHIAINTERIANIIMSNEFGLDCVNNKLRNQSEIISKIIEENKG